MEVTLVSPVWAEFDDLDNYFTAEESLTDDEDEYLNNAKINFEPVEETNTSLSQWDRFIPTYECCSPTENVTHENRSEKVPEREHQRNTEKTTKVVYDFFFEETSKELTEFGSNYLSKHEFSRDDMHLSKLQGHVSDIKDRTDEMVNNITCNFMERQHMINESVETNKGPYELKFETSNSKEIGSFSKCTGHVGNKQNKPQKTRRFIRRRMSRGSLADILKWQTSLQRNNTVLYDIFPGIAEGKPALHQIAQGDVNDNREDSSRVNDTNAAEDCPENLREVKSCTQQGCSSASGTQKPVSSRHEDCSQNKRAGSCNCCKKMVFQIDQASDDSVTTTVTPNRGACKNKGSYSLQPAKTSAGLSLSITNTLSGFFDSASLFSVGKDENFNLEWIRLTTFSDWPLTSIFSTTLARNGWVSLGVRDRARCYCCHVVHEGWRIGDDPDQYHSPNCRFKNGQSDNIPIFRATSDQNPNPRQISRDHRQFNFPGNPVHLGNLSEGASSVDHLDPVHEVSEQGLNRPQQVSFLPQDSNIQHQETDLQHHGNFPRPKETYPQAYDMRETTMACNQTVTFSQLLSVGLPFSEKEIVPIPRQCQSSNTHDLPRNTDTQSLQVPEDYLDSTADVTPIPRNKEAQLEAFKRDPIRINFDRPKYPSYAILAERIRSYNDRSATMTQTPRDMALAGFFYAGYGDYTRCFFCGGGLRNWESREDPWVEHARWFKKCAFVRQNKGQKFIDLVHKRVAESDDEKNREELENSQITTSTSDPRSAQAKEDKVMRSPAVTIIKEMGYSEDKIKAAIHTIKGRLPREKHKVSAQEILEAIFKLNQSESGTPVGQSERSSENFTNRTNQSDSVAENTAHHHHMSQSDPAPEGNLNSTNEDASAMDNSNAELTSLRQENSSLKDQILCKICMDEKVSIAFLPCGHIACCEDCAPAMRKCPICMEFVRHYLEAILVLSS